MHKDTKDRDKDHTNTDDAIPFAGQGRPSSPNRDVSKEQDLATSGLGQQDHTQHTSKNLPYRFGI